MKNNIFLVFLLSLELSLCAQTINGIQDNSSLKTQYPFLELTENVFKYESTSPSLDAFVKKWNQVTKTDVRRQTSDNGQQIPNNINIIHIGGSHVQAGTLTHRIRCNLLLANPQLVGPRGMLFPYSAAAKCNNPSDYRVHCVEKVGLTRNVYKEPQHNMGLCGIAVTATDTTTIQICMNEPRFDFSAQTIVLLGESPDTIIPRLLIQERQVFPSYIYPEKHRYVFHLSHPVDSFDIYIPCKDNQTFTLTGVYLSNKRPGITYHSIGVNGAAVPDYLKCAYLKQDLTLVNPDMVVFGIGINDAAAPNFDTLAFRLNYQQLIDTIRSVNPQCALVFITNNDSFRKVKRHTYNVNKNGLLAREVFYRLAHDNGGIVWDQFQIMGGLKSMDKWRLAKLAQNDRVHFTRAGYELVGDLFSNAFFRWIDTYQLPSNPPAPKSKPLNNQGSEQYPYISY